MDEWLWLYSIEFMGYFSFFVILFLLSEKFLIEKMSQTTPSEDH